MSRAKLLFLKLDKERRHIHTGLEKEWGERGQKMNILWIVNTNTFLLILLIIMVSYLTMQVNALIRWLRRE
jgi:hypothetical protein